VIQQTVLLVPTFGVGAYWIARFAGNDRQSFTSPLA